MTLRISIKYSHYKMGIFISSLSMAFGILREFIIVGMLGFSAKNDMLQVYLSIFYTIGLTIDAMRLSCLNLYSVLSLSRMLVAASILGLPLAIMIGVMMSYSIGGLSNLIIIAAIMGGFLNLIVALLITYKQRNNAFIIGQVINVMPNFILIPGIMLCFFYSRNNLVSSIVLLTSVIPVVQLIILLVLPNKPHEALENNTVSFLSGIITFSRHFSSMIGEQLFQIIARAAFFNYGTGYLSVFSIMVRIYSATRFILIDSYIGSKLANWKNEFQYSDYYLSKLVNSTRLSLLIAVISFIVCLYSTNDLLRYSIQMAIVLVFGFYFSTIVRIVYFKINNHENNAALIVRFAIYELFFSVCAFVITKQMDYPLFALLWVGYIAKPLAQGLFLRKRLYTLAIH